MTRTQTIEAILNHSKFYFSDEQTELLRESLKRLPDPNLFALSTELGIVEGEMLMYETAGKGE